MIAIVVKAGDSSGRKGDHVGLKTFSGKGLLRVRVGVRVGVGVGVGVRVGVRVRVRARIRAKVRAGVGVLRGPVALRAPLRLRHHDELAPD